MIASFKHRGLKALYEGRTARRVAPEHLRKLVDILTVLDQSRTRHDLVLPGFRLHSLKDKKKTQYAIDVSGNWRVIFRFNDGDVVDVDFIDYR